MKEWRRTARLKQEQNDRNCKSCRKGDENHRFSANVPPGHHNACTGGHHQGKGGRREEYLVGSGLCGGESGGADAGSAGGGSLNLGAVRGRATRLTAL
jgi:hypothetical protein